MTKRLTGAVAIAVLVAATLLGTASPTGAQQSLGGEQITSYDVRIKVEANGDLVVTEVLDYDFGLAQRHGIFRDIPVRFRYDDRYDRVYPLSDITVEGSPGTPDQFELSTASSYKRIKIGDPDRTISGAHRYTISYRVKAALNAFADHDELYWNAVGSEWPAPIGRAKVSVDLPGPVGDIACFAGYVGSRLSCEGSAKSAAGAQFAHEQLAPYEGLTVVVGMGKGVVPEPVPVLDERWSLARAFEATPATVGGGGALLVLLVVGVSTLIWRTGRDRRFVGSPVDVAFGTAGDAEEFVPLMERPLTPVEYEPPDKLRPGQVGTLVDEQANPLDVTATIVDLAVRGYLRIDAVEKQGWFGKPDWVLTRLKESDDKLLAYESKLADGLFSSGDTVKLSELRNTFAVRLKGVQDALYDDAVARGWFSSRPDSTRTAWTAIGVIGLVAAIGLTVVAVVFTHLALLGLPFIVGAVVLLLGAKRMPKRTAIGTGVLRRTQGFRRFIEESEMERARFAERANLFSEYLPYAIVFGCTEKWAKAFAGLDDQLPETDWYRANTAFTAVAFADSIDGFTVSTAGTIASTPSGSGSGSSGFSGGSSGGGGGGGGGGSW